MGWGGMNWSGIWWGGVGSHSGGSGGGDSGDGGGVCDGTGSTRAGESEGDGYGGGDGIRNAGGMHHLTAGQRILPGREEAAHEHVAVVLAWCNVRVVYTRACSRYRRSEAAV